MDQTEAENRGIDQALFNSLNNRYKNLFCYETMGIKLMYLDQQAAGMKMIPNIRLSTTGGRIHGGIISVLTDAVMGAAGATMGNIYRTVEMKLNYMAPVFDCDVLIAKARVIHAGNTYTVIEGDIYNQEGKLTVKSLGTYVRDKNNAYV
jgi:uncharacterized domain 1